MHINGGSEGTFIVDHACAQAQTSHKYKTFFFFSQAGTRSLLQTIPRSHAHLIHSSLLDSKGIWTAHFAQHVNSSPLVN